MHLAVTLFLSLDSINVSIQVAAHVGSDVTISLKEVLVVLCELGNICLEVVVVMLGPKGSILGLNDTHTGGHVGYEILELGLY